MCWGCHRSNREQARNPMIIGLGRVFLMGINIF
jgi:hypothetical protein